MKLMHSIDYYWIINFWREIPARLLSYSLRLANLQEALKINYGFCSYGIHLTECSALTLRLFHQDSQPVFLIYVARFLHSYSPVVLTQFAVTLRQPFYFYHILFA